MGRIVLTDIEGTISDIAFVRNVLFPYARDALPAFVATNGDRDDVRRELAAAIPGLWINELRRGRPRQLTPHEQETQTRWQT